jgi:hypothetical protein
MKRSPRPRMTLRLSGTQHQFLNTYALAATGAVGVLALVPPSEAKIVYTPIHKTIKLHQHYNLDLNHDGITDFTLELNSFHTRNTSAFSTLRLVPTKPNAAEGGSHGTSCGGGHGAGPYAFALGQGALISPKHPFHGNPNLMGVAGTIDDFSVFCGPWLDVKNRYLGLQFQIRGETHFGWARLNVASTPISITSATLTGFAYETIPNKPINAGKIEGPEEGSIDEANPATLNEPLQAASLGLLAMGSPGLSVWRREESVGPSTLLITH